VALGLDCGTASAAGSVNDAYRDIPCVKELMASFRWGLCDR